MGRATPLAVSVEAPGLGRVVLRASDGKNYHADLSSFTGVYCYPKDEATWRRVSIDAHGYALIWPTRFEVHVDQIIALADRVEPAQQAG